MVFSNNSKNENPIVSYFKSVTSKSPIDKPILSVLTQIQSEDFKIQIENLRLANNKQEKELLKKQLPCISVSGVFKNGHAANDLIQRSGLIQVDFDSVLNPDELKEKLRKDVYTYACFISPSGTGIKAIVKILPEFHLESFEALTTYYAIKYDALMAV